MRTIYDGAKHREPWAWLFLSLGALFIGVGIYTLIRPEFGVATLIGLGIVGLGVWTIADEFRFRRRLPLEVLILDSGAIRVKAKYVTRAYNAEQLTTITYIFESTFGRLFLNADGAIWYLPCSTVEAENIIAALVSLKPALRVERRDASCSGGG